ncbi:MAG: CsbD family protein [Arthrobacter sp.]|jgi:uncharacterized protein YjbJ (UPF0337 family)|nr:CsbD family protein [Arthrobacter sp.]
MGFEEAKDKIAGKAKEAFGKVTGDKETEAEGAAQAASAGAKEKVNDAVDSVKGAVKGLKGDGDK